MEELGQSPENCFTGYLLALMEVNDGQNGCEFLPEVEITEEMVVEVMQELLKEINTCGEVKTSPPMTIFPATMSSSSFVVGGDNERCGPSFSDSASTVMAGVGMGPTKVLAGYEEVGFRPVVVRKKRTVVMMMSGWRELLVWTHKNLSSGPDG